MKQNYLLVHVVTTLGESTFKIEDKCVAESLDEAWIRFRESRRYVHTMAVVSEQVFRGVMHKAMHELWTEWRKRNEQI